MLRTPFGLQTGFESLLKMKGHRSDRLNPDFEPDEAAKSRNFNFFAMPVKSGLRYFLMVPYPVFHPAFPMPRPCILQGQILLCLSIFNVHPILIFITHLNYKYCIMAHLLLQKIGTVIKRRNIHDPEKENTDRIRCRVCPYGSGGWVGCNESGFPGQVMRFCGKTTGAFWPRKTW